MLRSMDMYPNILVEGRGTGRTTRLIEWASQEQPPPAPMRYIVTGSLDQSTYVFNMARGLGLEIAFPVTWDEMVQQRTRRRPGGRMVEYGIDNLSLVLPRLVPGKIGPVVW